MRRPDPRLVLVEAAIELKRAAPARWDEFLLAFEVYSQSVRDMLLTEPMDTLPVLKGKAIATSALLQTLSDAPSLLDQLKRDRR